MVWEVRAMSSLQELRSTISADVAGVGRKPYSHNLISLTLASINADYGVEAANEAIEDHNLEELGWKKQCTNP